MASQTCALSTILFACLAIATVIEFAESTNLTIKNNCKETIWPGIAPNNNSAPDTNFSGDCGSTLKCKTPAKPPASIAQFAFGDLDYYDVSLVDGFNLPIADKPVSGKGNCSTAGCDSDLRLNCPSELAVNSSGKSIACNSACTVFNTDEYCCRGAFSSPMTQIIQGNSRMHAVQLIAMPMMTPPVS